MTNRTATLPASITDQLDNAKTLAMQIDVVTKVLAGLMDQLHGEEIRYTVSHEAGAEFIMLSPGMKRGRSSRG